MIKVVFEGDAVTRVRFGSSPLWEAIASIELLLRHRVVPEPYRHWARSTRQRLPVHLVARLPAIHRQLRPSSAGARLPVPAAEQTTLHDELAAMVALNAQHRDLTRAAGVLADYWDIALAPSWPSIRSALDHELTQRARRVLTGGYPAALVGLGGQAVWKPPVLLAPAASPVEVICSGTFCLVPMAFAAGRSILVAGEQEHALSYQAPVTGLPRADEPPQPTTEERLALLVGDGRARVIRALESPATTTTVAESLGLAKSTVSQHLGALHAAGVVRRQRSGNHVIYELDHAGFELLRLF